MEPEAAPRALPRYGVDAPYVPAAMGLAGAIALVLGLISGEPWLALVGVIFLAQTGVYLHTTLRGKFEIWEELLDEIDLDGDEKALDIGCGRGAVLLAVARRLPGGEAHGVDLWRSRDQSGNDEAATIANARAAGVVDRVHLHTGDMTDLRFRDGSFDLVTSSLAIHNLPGAARLDALDEALRVLAPGGRIVIADIRTTRRYAQHLKARGAVDVARRGLGLRGWFGGPWQAVSVVIASRPPS